MSSTAIFAERPYFKALGHDNPKFYIEAGVNYSNKVRDLIETTGSVTFGLGITRMGDRYLQPGLHLTFAYFEKGKAENVEKVCEFLSTYADRIQVVPLYNVGLTFFEIKAEGSEARYQLVHRVGFVYRDKEEICNQIHLLADREFSGQGDTRNWHISLPVKIEPKRPDCAQNVKEHQAFLSLFSED